VTHLLPVAALAILRQQIFSTPFAQEDNSEICALTASPNLSKNLFAREVDATTLAAKITGR
jgi:hypothetical protein